MAQVKLSLRWVREMKKHPSRPRRRCAAPRAGCSRSRRWPARCIGCRCSPARRCSLPPRGSRSRSWPRWRRARPRWRSISRRARWPPPTRSTGRWASPARLSDLPFLRPPVTLLLRLADAVLLRSGAQARYTPPPPPLEQIEKILSDEARSGSSAPPPEMVHGLFSFAARTAKEVMVPRTRVVGVGGGDAAASDRSALRGGPHPDAGL